jgi:hypothetical protein
MASKRPAILIDDSSSDFSLPSLEFDFDNLARNWPSGAETSLGTLSSEAYAFENITDSFLQWRSDLSESSSVCQNVPMSGCTACLDDLERQRDDEEVARNASLQAAQARKEACEQSASDVQQSCKSDCLQTRQSEEYAAIASIIGVLCALCAFVSSDDAKVCVKSCRHDGEERDNIEMESASNL